MATRMVQARFNAVIVPQLIVSVLGSVAALVISAALWFGGATSTVILATAITQAVAGSVGAWWPWYAIGIVFSVVEIWDRRETGGSPKLKRLALYITHLDTLSTAHRSTALGMSTRGSEEARASAALQRDPNRRARDPRAPARLNNRAGPLRAR